jgi:hypothetical protein
MIQKINNNIHILEILGINILNIGVLTWIHYIPTLITSLVGVSILALNGIKIYKELKNNDKSSNK